MYKLFQKFLASFLSFLMIYTSVLPAYAQAEQSAAAQRMPFETGTVQPLPMDAVSRAMEQAQFEHYKQVKNVEHEIWERNFGDLSREINEVVDLLTKDEDNKTNYDYFREAYMTQLYESYEKEKAKLDKELKNLDVEYSRLRKREAIADLCEEAENKASCELAYRNLLIEMYKTGKAEIQEAKFELDNWYNKQSREQAVQAAYKKVGAEFDKELEKLKAQQDKDSFEAGKAYIQGLGSRIHAKKYTAAVEEAYPLFHSIGALKEADRAWGAQVLRQEIANEKSYCKEVDFKTRFHGAEQEQQGKCNGAISAAGALTIIGKGQEDKDALFDLLKEGHNGIMAPSVIMAAGMGLVALGGANLLALFIREKAQEIPPSWQISLAVISLEEWGRAFRELEEGGEWLGYNQQASLYQVQKGKKGYRSAWSDLGIYLGLEAKAGNKDAKNAISAIVGEGNHGLIYLGYNSSDWISVKFPAVLEGILASGYQLNDSFLTRDGYYEMDSQGKQTYVNPKAKWAGTKQYLDKNHLDLTGYLIKVLYFGGKSDLDPWSRLIIRNELVTAYNEVPNRPKYKGMVSQRAPSQEEINSYQHWQNVLSNLRGVDIVLAIIGVLALGTGLVKGFASGVRGIAKLSKTLKIARAGMGAARGTNGFAKMYGRVVRLGTLQKSGTSSYRLYRINQASKVLETQSILPKVPVKNLPVKLSSKMKARARQSIMQATEEAYQAERAAAQAAAQATAKVPLSATPEVKLAGPAYTGPVKVTHTPQPVTNAMGQTVMQYRPIKPEPIVKPSGWNAFKTNIGQRWNWFSVGTKDLGGQFLKAFRSKVAGTALVIGLNTTPLPSTGLGAFVKAGNTIRTELVMGRATKGLAQSVTALPRTAASATELGHIGVGLRTTAPLNLKAPANIAKAGLGFNLPFSGSLPYLLPFSLQAIGIDSRAGNWLGIGGGGGFRLSEKDYSRLLLPYENMPLASNDKLTPTVQSFATPTVGATAPNTLAGLSQSTSTTQTQVTSTPAAPAASARAGYLYSGIPFFAIGNGLKNVWNRMTRANRVTNVEEARHANAARAAVLGSAISLLAALAGFADFVAPAVALLKDSLGLSTFMASLVTLSGFGMFGLSIPFGRLQSQIGRMPMMRMGLGLSTLGLAIPSVVLGGAPLTTMPQFWTVLGSIALLCAGSTILKNAASALAFDVAQTDAEAASMLSSLDAWKIIPTVLNWVLPTVVLAANGYSWTLLFPIYGAISLAGLVASLFMNVAESAPATATAADTNTQPATPTEKAPIWPFVAGGASYIAAEIFALSNTPMLLTDVFNMTPATANIVTLSTIVAGIFASRFAGTYLPSRYLGTPRQRLIVSSAVALAGLGLVMTGVPALSIAGLFTTGFGYGNIFPMLVNMAQSARPAEVDRTTSIMMTSIAAGGATPLLAALSDVLGPLWSFAMPMALISGILAVGLRAGKTSSPAILASQLTPVSAQERENVPFPSLPAESAVYRGMHFNSVAEVQNILSHGLKANYRDDHAIYLSPKLSTAVGYATNTEDQIPVVLMVPMDRETIKRASGSYSNAGEILRYKDIVPEEISHVLTYMEKDGVRGWYRLSLNGNQELIATPWESYLSAQTAIVSTTSRANASLYLNPQMDTESVITPKIPASSTRRGTGQNFGVPETYLRILDRIKELDNALPEGLDSQYALFRGMTVKDLSDVDNILVNGLELSKIDMSNPVIYFSSSLEGGDGSTPLFFAANPVTANIPLLIVRKSTTGGKQAHRLPYIIFDQDMPASDIEVFAFLQQDGKGAWYQMAKEANGQLKATPINDYLQQLTSSAAGTATSTAANKEISVENVAWQKRVAEFPNPYTTTSLLSATEKYLIPAFPSDLLTGKQMIYRGQGMSLAGLQQLLRDGMLRSSSADANTIPFSYDANVAIHHARGEAVPVVFGYAVNKQFIKQHPGINQDLQEVTVDHDLALSDMDFVAAYLTIDGKEGWYQVSLDQNGQIQTTPLADYIAAQVAPNAFIRAWNAVANWFSGLGASKQAGATAATGKEVEEEALYLNPQTDTRKILTPKVQTNTPVRVNRLEELYDALPAGFEAEYDLFRGMTLNSLTQLDNILVNGLEIDKSSLPEIYFSSSLIGEDPGSSAAIAYASRATSANIPVIIARKQSAQGQINGNVTFEQDIPASEVDVYAYLHQGGKGAWYHMTKEADGHLKAISAARSLQALPSEVAPTAVTENWWQTFAGKVSNAYHKAMSSKGNLYSSFIPGVPQFLKFVEALTDEFSGGSSATQGPVQFKRNRFAGADHSQDQAAGDKAIPLSQLDPMPLDARPTMQELEEYDKQILKIHGGKEAWDVLWGTVFSNHGRILMPWHYFNGPRPSSTTYLNQKGEEAANPVPVPADIKSFIDAKLPAEVRNNDQVKQTVILDASDWHGQDITEFILFAEQCFKAYGRDNVLVLFGGDGFTGSYLLNAKPEWGLSGLVNMGVDVFTMGNHEADVLKTFTKNITLLNMWNQGRSAAMPSMVGTAPTFLAGKQRILLGSGIETLPYTIKVSGNGERIAVIGLGKPGYGNEQYPVGKKEQAQETFEESLNATVAYLQQNAVDHIVILMHESLNDTRKDTRAKQIAAAINKMPEKMKQLIRVVYEGHTHIPENTMNEGINYVNPGGFPKKTLAFTVLARDGMNGTTYSYSTVFDTADRSKVPAGQENAADNKYQVMHTSYQAATEALQQELNTDPNQPIVQLVGPLTSRVSKSSIYLEPAMANAVADGFYWNAKRLSRETDATGVTKILRTKDGRPIEKYNIIGAATYMNTGKPLWQDVITLSALTGYFPNPEPFAVRPITGKQFIQFVHDNFIYVDDLKRDGAPAQITSTYGFSHNVRIAVQGLKVVDGKIDNSQAQVAVYILGPERKYIPMDENETYYMAMPHHMMVGLYESALFKNTDLYGAYDYIYKETKQSFSEMMRDFFEAAAISKGYQTKATPAKFYSHKLDHHTDGGVQTFKTYYWQDEKGTWKELTAEDEARFIVTRDRDNNPTELIVLDENGVPVVKNRQLVKHPVRTVPLFYTHIGRIVNLDELLKGEKSITQKQLDLLYSGALSWEEVFGPIAAPEADPTELPSEDAPLPKGGTPAPAGSF